MDTFQDPREKRREVRCKVHCKENWLVFNFLPHFATSSTLCARASLAGPGWCHCCNRSKPKVCIKSVAATALVQICAVNRNPNDWFKLSEQIRRSTAQSLLMQNKAKSRVSNLPLRAKTQRHKVTSLTAKLLRDSGHSAIACSLQSPASASVWTQSPCQGKAGQRLKRKFMRLQHCSLLLTWFETPWNFIFDSESLFHVSRCVDVTRSVDQISSQHCGVGTRLSSRWECVTCHCDPCYLSPTLSHNINIYVFLGLYHLL